MCDGSLVFQCRPLVLAIGLPTAALVCQCQRGDPAPAGPASGAPPHPSLAASEAASPAPGPASGAPAHPGASAQPPSPADSVGAPEVASAAPATSGSAEAAGQPSVPPLRDASGAALPQTDDRPRLDSAFFKRLGPALFEAVVRDEPEVARPFFFPVDAYEQVKAIARPARDWEQRLMRAFERNIHEYHLHLGRNRDQARYLDIEVPEDQARWMKPGSEGNRIGYWRVLRSHLIYLDDQQRRRRLEITSFISWRGEWYVVHLNGFK